MTTASKSPRSPSSRTPRPKERPLEQEVDAASLEGLLGVDLVFDTFAWIELLGRGPHGPEVEALHVAHDVATPALVFAELADVYARRAPEHWGVVEEAVLSTSIVAPLTHAVASAAGRTKARLRGERPGIGLADCIAYETARALRAELVTGDAHLEGLPGVHFLR